MLFALCASAEAQQLKKVSRIGFLAGISSSSISARTEAFRQGLRELGYIEGENIVVEWRYADEKIERLNHFVSELIRLKVEVIVTAAPVVTRPVREATATIPIVMAFDDDPVGNGFVASLARPGGNITGLSNLSPEIGGKQLGLLKEIVPRFTRLAVLGMSTRPGNARTVGEIEEAAGSMGVEVQVLDVKAQSDIEIAFRAAGKARAGGVIILGGPVFNARRRLLVDIATNSRLPSIYPRGEFVEAGG
jgi:putative ABC transport system substrate-binding protein